MADEVVGRGVELAVVERFVERGAQSLAALVVEGEPGIGKTTIWEAALDAARARGWLVLSSRPARSERGLTLGGLSDLLRDLDGSVLARLAEPQRYALEVALLRVLPSGAPPDQRTLSVAVSSLLRQLASPAQPVLLALDDAQWLDESTTAILAYAIRRLGDRPLGLLVSLRAGSAGPDDLDLRTQVAEARTERIRLGPLPLGSLHRLFMLRLGRSFPRIVLVRIEAASGGNPLYGLEIARALLRTGIPTDPRQPLPVPDTLGSLMAGRVSALPGPTRRAMLLAAAAAEPTLGTLERADPGGAAALRPAIEDDIVVIDGDLIRFAHPLLAQAVTGLAQPADLRSAHAALAAASTSAAARARHLGLAADGPDEAVAEALSLAALDARQRGATLDAAGLYEEAAG